MKKQSVMQEWTLSLTLMQQSVLIASVRGPDGIKKNHPTKKLCRWLRRCFLISAFDNRVIDNPVESTGGSFTGPSICVEDLYDLTAKKISLPKWHKAMDKCIDEYLSCVDELPHHFQLHFMHAAEILGYKHPTKTIRFWWNKTYLRLVNDAHLVPESKQKMEKRLGDNETNWKNAEEVTAE